MSRTKMFSPFGWVLFTLCHWSSVFGLTNADFRSPTGVKMCITLCVNHGNCHSPKLDLKEMSCHLTNGAQGQTSVLDLKIIRNIVSSEKNCQGLYRNVLTRNKGFKCIHEPRKPMEIIATTNTSWYHYSEDKKLWKQIAELPAPHELILDESTGRVYWILHNKTSNMRQIETAYPTNLSNKTTLYTTSDYACSLVLDYRLRVIYVAVVQPTGKEIVLFQISEESKSVTHFKNITAEGVRMAISVEKKKIFVWCDLCYGKCVRCLVEVSDNGDKLHYLPDLCQKLHFFTYNKNNDTFLFLCRIQDGRDFLYHISTEQTNLICIDIRLPPSSYRTVFVLTEEIMLLLGKGGEIYDKRLRLKGRIPVWDDAETPSRAVVYPAP